MCLFFSTSETFGCRWIKEPQITEGNIVKQEPKPHMLVWKISVRHLDPSLGSWDSSRKFWAEKWHYLSYISTRIPQTLLKLHHRGTRTKTRRYSLFSEKEWWWQIYSDFWEGMMVPNSHVTEKKQEKFGFYIYINKKAGKIWCWKMHMQMYWREH